MHFPEDHYDYSNAVRLQAGFGWETPPQAVGPDWRPNVPFEATLHLVDSRRGRSAAYFVWNDAAGREFPMFITDMLALVKSGVTIAEGGIVTTRWMVTKRGANYGIRHAAAEETGG